MKIEINHKRLLNNIQTLAKIGMNEGGGIDRAFGSQADIEAREWLMNYWKLELGLETRIDPIANMWIEWEGTEQVNPIVIGSHHDTVPDGGKYDGALGVLLATEILQTLIENQVHLIHPLSVVSFTGEEPNPFNVSTLGSKVVSGRLLKKDLLKQKHRDTDESLGLAIRRVGGDISQLENALLTDNQVSGFLECHIEQGKRLEQKNLPVATVSGITGIHREIITIYGEANHAGTTMMYERKDAMLGAAEVALAIEEVAKDFKDVLVATIGFFEIEPNEANIIPGKAKMILDLRTYYKELEVKALTLIKDKVRTIENNRKVKIVQEVILDQPPIPMHDEVIKSVNAGIYDINEEPIELVSMAGHDAANMARVTKSGMIFLKSMDGKSHCKEEYSTDEDIRKVGNAMLSAVFHLDKELE